MSIESIKRNIIEVELKINDLTKTLNKKHKDLNKAMEEGDMVKAHFMVQSMTTYFELLTNAKEYLEEYQSELKIEEEATDGWQKVVDFAKEIYEKDIKWHCKLKLEYSLKGDNHFRELLKKKELTRSTYELMKMSDDEARKIFRQDLESRIQKLKQQITNKVGTLIECVGFERNENAGFDGTFIGEDGSCRVSTIGAGGYNIQRFHFRTTVRVSK